MGIAILVKMCLRVAKNAKDRDKSPINAILYTIALWLIFGFIGFVISGYTLVFHDNSYPTIVDLLWILFIYATYLGFGILGGSIANRISRKKVKLRTSGKSEQDRYINYFSDDEELKKPCKITIINDSDMFAKFAKFTFKINGEDLGRIKQNQGIVKSTSKRKNTLQASRERDGLCLDEYKFIVPDGGEVEVHFFDKDFDNSKTKIIRGHLPLIDEEAI